MRSFLRRFGIQAVLVSVAVAGTRANAATVLSYSFDTFNGGSTPTAGARSSTTGGAFTNGTNTNFDPSNVPTHFSGSQLTASAAAIGSENSFLAATNAGSAYTINNGYEIAEPQLNQTSGAIPSTSTSSYLQFSITPDGGYGVTYSNFTFDFGYDNNTTASSSVKVGAALYASTDAGATFTQMGSNLAMTLTSATSYAIQDNLSVNLTSLGDIRSAVIFRLYVAGAGSNANNRLMFLDDFNVNGTILTPEPTSLSLLSFAGLLALRRRRRSA